MAMKGSEATNGGVNGVLCAVYNKNLGHDYYL
jgi:hypothetical protein